MAQQLEAFIARTDVLRRFASHVPGFRMLALPQGLSLGPMPEPLRPQCIDNLGTVGAWTLPDELAAVAATVSQHGDVGWIETTPGWEGVAMWRNGMHSVPSNWDHLLQELGVIAAVPRVEHGWFMRVIVRPRPPRPQSEWRTLGLDNWRSSEGAYNNALPVDTAP